MTNSKSTKRALVTSALAILMCVAMLIGTTFAWFTDTASTGVNKIQAGNLDVELEYSSDATNWKTVTTSTKIFNESALWEPGYTEVVYLRAVNKGNLALKYTISLAENYRVQQGTNVFGEKYAIGDYLKVGGVYTDGKFVDRDAAQAAIADVERDFTDGYTMDSGKILKKGETSQPFAAVIYMPTTVGNEANAKSGTKPSYIAWVGVRLYATQATEENDSFDNQYDVKAPTAFRYVQYTSGTHEVTENIQANGDYGVVKVDGGTTTINADLYAVYKDNAAMAVWADGNFSGTKNGHVIIEGGNFRQVGVPDGEPCDLIYATVGATIEINGGTFKATTPANTLNCKDGSNAHIIVNGGRFYKYDPSHPTMGDGEVSLGEGCTVTQDGDWFVVSK